MLFVAETVKTVLTLGLTTIEFEVRLPFQVYEEAPKALRVILCKAHITVSGEALSAGPPI